MCSISAALNRSIYRKEFTSLPQVGYLLYRSYVSTEWDIAISIVPVGLPVLGDWGPNLKWEIRESLLHDFRGLGPLWVLSHTNH